MGAEGAMKASRLGSEWTSGLLPCLSSVRDQRKPARAPPYDSEAEARGGCRQPSCGTVLGLPVGQPARGSKRFAGKTP